MNLKVGDLVICNCAAQVWYKGMSGIVVEIDFLKDIHVLYGNGEILRLVGSALEVINESR